MLTVQNNISPTLRLNVHTHVVEFKAYKAKVDDDLAHTIVATDPKTYKILTKRKARKSTSGTVKKTSKTTSKKTAKMADPKKEEVKVETTEKLEVADETAGTDES